MRAAKRIVTALAIAIASWSHTGAVERADGVTPVPFHELAEAVRADSIIDALPGDLPDVVIDSASVERHFEPDAAEVFARETITPDTLAYQPLFPYHPKKKTDNTPDSLRKLNIVQKIVRYFDDANKPKTDKKFDITFVGGPSYSAATSVELAAIGAGIYRTRRDGGITPESDISLKLEGSVTGFYNVGVSGNHFGPGDRYRIIYDANFMHFPLDFWGIGYYNQSRDENKSKYTRLQADFKAEFQWRLPGHVYIGGGTYFLYGKATKVERPELWEGQELRQFNYGLGVLVSYDTRDNVNSATRGVNLRLSHQFYPAFLFNKHHYMLTELTAGYYRTLWRGGVLAMQAHCALTFGDTPWTALPTLDQSGGIRSYYDGRYASSNEADIVVELRQKVWRRNGLVIWGGVGSVFHRVSEVTVRNLLPSIGIGYRWEFKRNTNVRVDIGLGRGSKAISLGLHESF